MTEGAIERSTIREKYREADSELDLAVEKGKEKQQAYWLGRKEALKDLLGDRPIDTDTDRIDCLLCDETSETPEAHEQHMAEVHDA